MSESKNSNSINSPSHNIDYVVFWGGITLMLALTVGALLFPEPTIEITNFARDWVINQFGLFFMLFGIFTLVASLYLAFSKYGKIRMGKSENGPEYSFLNWFAMIFFSALGSSTVLWAICEPIAHLSVPPFGLQAFSKEAIELAIPYSIFHWGPTAWSFYALSGVAVAFPFYILNKKILKISVAMDNVFDSKTLWGIPAKVIDIFTIFFTFCAYGPSFGLAVPTLSLMVCFVFGLNDSMLIQNIIMLVWTIIFTTSVYKGINKGIKILSDINLIMLIVAIFVVFIISNPAFIVKESISQIGIFAMNFLKMNGYYSAGAQSIFMKDWTVFYWSWWVAMAPFMALFIAKISKGRTIQEMILGIIGGGSLGTMLIFFVFGNYALKIQQNTVDLTKIYNTDGVAATVLATVSTMPFNKLMMVLMVLLYLVFIATCVDSSAFTMACIASKEIKDNEQPQRINRVIWALLIAALGFAVLRLGGGLLALQTIVVAIGLPAALIVVILAISLFKHLRDI